MSERRLADDIKTMYTTIVGIPDGAEVVEVLNWHEEEPRPTPTLLAMYRRQVREWSRLPGGKP